MLRWRLLLGSLLIAALAGLCWLDAQATRPGTWLIPLAMVFSVLASGDLLWLYSARGLHPPAWLVYGGNAAIVASAGAQFVLPSPALGPLERLAWPLLTLTACTLLAIVVEIRRYRQPGEVVVNLALTVLSLVYVGLFMSFLVQLRLLEQVGMAALVSMIAVVKSADTGAYAIGRLCGKHKLAPLLSPGKTIEGAAGAIVAGVLASWLVLEVWNPHGTGPLRASAPSWGFLVYGLMLALAGMVGDLAESLLKRDMGRKDSSDWLPGFGGVLDVIDSLLVAAPIAYVCWLAGLPSQ